MILDCRLVVDCRLTIDTGYKGAFNRGLRVALGLVCAWFAIVIGLPALLGIVELLLGQRHAPAVLLAWIINSSFGVFAGFAAWRLFQKQ